LALQLGVVDPASVRAEIEKTTAADGLAVLAARQLRPAARAAEGAALGRYASAMIDISDGFALDLERLCRASGVGCEVDAAALPLDPELGHAVRAIEGCPEPVEMAIVGGEDFELLFTVAPDRVDDMHGVLDEIGTSVSVVGVVIEGDSRSIDERPLARWSEHVWDHLRNQ
jgi:thiamine-monophosphate kinase